MLQRFLACFLMVTFLAQPVNASSGQSIKDIFDELNYSLNVEWDQKDKIFYEAQVEKFKSKIEGLRAQGISQAQIVEYSLKEIKNKTVAKDLISAVNLVQMNIISSDEFDALTKKIIAHSYSRGASWDSETFFDDNYGYIVAVVLVGILTISYLATRCQDVQYHTVCADIGDCTSTKFCNDPVDYGYGY